MLDHTVSQPVRPPEETPDDTPIGKKLARIVGRLEEEAARRVQRRSGIEQRWIADLQQLHGVYPTDVMDRMKSEQGSQVYMNLTAPKTEAMKARLFDLLFPTDDRNWGISPTPVPDLAKEAEAAMNAALEAKEAADAQQKAVEEAEAAGNEQAAAQAEGMLRQAEAVENKAQAKADDLQAILQEAKRRCDLMQEEIADQLVGCMFPSEARDMIDDACEIGCGVLKGPVIGERARQKWGKVQQPAEDGTLVEVDALVTGDEDAPAVYRVDPWGFFPDPDARRVQDGEGVFERHLMTRTKLKRLARRPDIDADAVRAILRVAPEIGKAPNYLTELAAIKGGEAQTRDLYQVWEYAGPLDAEDMMALAEAGGDMEMLDALGEPDPLAEVNAKVWFCQGRVLAFALHPLDSGETVYSTYAIRKDAASPYGYGIPSIIRDAQSVVNAAYRMMMDNAGLSTGPQVIVNKDLVSPQDNDWTIRPRKVWIRNGSKGAPGIPAFEAFTIPSNQGDIAAIIGLGAQTIDETAAMPAIAQGEQGAQTTQTFGGLALLMNAANVLFRRMVKDFDDDVTTPIIRRFYDWNMQFSSKAEIKGDYQVEARGAAVLLVREMQASNLMLIAQAFGDHPEYGPMLKKRELLKQVFKSVMLSSDEVMLSDREYKEAMASMEEQVDPLVQAAQIKAESDAARLEMEREDMSLRASLAQMERDWRIQVAETNRDIAMAKVAEDMNMNREQLDARLAAQRMDADSKERKLAVEVADKRQTGIGAGGLV